MANPLYRNALLAVALASTTVAAGCSQYIKREDYAGPKTAAATM